MAQTPRKSESDPSPKGATTVVVPRAWLVALTVLLVLPWLALSGWYAWEEDLIDLSDDPDSAYLADSGPWGALTLTPIVISPPLEYVSTDFSPVRQPTWHFPAVTPDALEALLVELGVPAGTATAIRATARAETRMGGIVVFPAPEIVEGLGPDVRARLYERLGRQGYNYDQTHPFRFEGGSFDSWFDGSLISPTTRRLVEPLIYREREYLYFADLPLVRQRVGDEDEIRRLVKTLYRQATVLVELTVDDQARIDDLATYWGLGGRRTDLRPLLESVASAGGERSVDVAHLLPSFARNHLYRYPRVSTADYSRPIIANCLWTALNFFGDEPDDRYLDVPYALDRLRNDYHVIQSELRLGDIIGFVDPEGDLYHAAVYVADDLVFTKNGTTPMAPWTLMTIEGLKGYYRSLVREPRLIYHRRNGL
jgi:hypothetical protein